MWNTAAEPAGLVGQGSGAGVGMKVSPEEGVREGTRVPGERQN